MRRLLLLCLATLGLVARADDALPPAVQQALRAGGISPQAVAVVVQPLDGTPGALRYRPDAPMNPASLMKLVTTLAALETLGPAYTWRTEVLAAVPPRDGVLQGDLYLRGSGDPKLTYDRLWLLLRELRDRGLVDIRGDLVLDNTAFAPFPYDPAAFDGKPQRPYNVGPDALLFNFGALHLTLVPGDKDVRVFAEPLPAGLRIASRLHLTENAPCSEDWRDRLTARFASGQVILSGDYPRACGEKQWHLAGLPNEALLSGVFTRLWRELGGRFGGTAREGATPPAAISLAFTESPPFGELVRDINKYSNNVMARQVFLKLGAGDTANAEQAIRAWLAHKELDFPELVMDNGAGLSREARISAGSLARLLAAGWASPLMPEYVASLPIAAIDGTLKKKLKGNGVAGHAHLKTGSLEGARGIAGYVQNLSGRRFIVVFMVNNENAARAQPAFDALLEWLWDGETPENQAGGNGMARLSASPIQPRITR